jgi:hypothetical protein
MGATSFPLRFSGDPAGVEAAFCELFVLDEGLVGVAEAVVVWLVVFSDVLGDGSVCVAVDVGSGVADGVGVGPPEPVLPLEVFELLPTPKRLMPPINILDPRVLPKRWVMVRKPYRST